MKIIESKFKYTAYLTLGLFIAVPIFNLFIFFELDIFNNDGPPVWFFIVPLTAMMIFAISELRKKLVKIVISGKEIMVRNFLGLGPEKKYRFKDLDGFYTSTIRAKNGTYNYTYLVQDGRKVAKISDQYHSNYGELKTIIGQDLSDLGYVNTSFLTEIKDNLNLK
jgi:hypothetical protein